MSDSEYEGLGLSEYQKHTVNGLVKKGSFAYVWTKPSGGKQVIPSDQVVKVGRSHDWPGSVREEVPVRSGMPLPMLLFLFLILFAAFSSFLIASYYFVLVISKI